MFAQYLQIYFCIVELNIFLINFWESFVYYVIWSVLLCFTCYVQLDAGSALSKGIDGLDGVLSCILGVHMAHIQSHITKVKGDMEARSRRQWLAIVVEFNTQVRVVDWLNAALKVGVLSLHQLSGTLQERKVSSVRSSRQEGLTWSSVMKLGGDGAGSSISRRPW